MGLYLKVEFTAGTHIERAIEEAITLADKLCIMIEFDFNGVMVLVTPSSKKFYVLQRFEKDLEASRK